VLCVTALGETLEKAKDNAYEAAKAVRMENSRYRSDIGLKGLRRLRNA
jgi:phosphoribosylamine--glycine ligase